MTEYVHTHVHTQFSLLDGAAHIDPLLKAVKAGGMNAIAITDHGSMHGTWQFYNAAKKAGVKPILGMEGYIVDDVAERSGKIGDYSHLLLFAEDYEGYRNLMRLTTESYRRGFYYKPRIDWAMLEQYSKGLIVTSGCLAGQIPQAIQADDGALAERLVGRYLDLFGRERFYVEVQDHEEPESPQVAVNRALYDLARRYDLPLLATNDSHYVARGDAPTHDMMLCVQMGKALEDAGRMRFGSENYYIKTPAEMAALFAGHEDALRNTLVLAERCNVMLPTGRNLIPVYEPPEGYASDAAYLYALCERGILERYGYLDEELRSRLDREFEVIRSKGFVAYFLIVWDYVNYARARGANCVARGSVAGSIVAYALGLSSVEPLRFGLPFERFLNPERNSMPDIDMDFPDDRREEIIRYVANKYGWDHVAQIATFNTMAAKAAVRDAGRVLNLRPEADRISRLIPSLGGPSLDKAVTEVPDLQKLYATGGDAAKVIDAAKGLEGTIRNVGIHAAGVIISREPVYEVVPCMVRKADQGGEGDVWLVTQHEQHDCEEQDLLKMDFLGLAALSTVRRCRELIKESRGEDVDLARVPDNDEATFKLLAEGDTTGVFQLEGAHMRMYIQDLKPTRVEDVMAMVALYRPGPMDSIPLYIKAKHGAIKPSYLHPKLEPILRDTYGVIVYQDQVLFVARELAGFSWGEVDKFRKAMGKKIAAEMHAQREKFIKGCVAGDIPQRIAEELFTFIEPFSGYGFNMAHAASYGYLAYQTAYLKAHYRAEFMAASLTTEAGDKPKVARLIRECLSHGVPVLPPDVNKSQSSFSVERTGDGTFAVRVGLSGIAGLGDTYLRMLLAARSDGVPFASLADIFARCGKITTANVSALVKAGACDAFGPRAALLATVEQSAKTGRAWRKKHLPQDGLFSNVREHVAAVPLGTAAPTKKEQVLQWEFESLGFYLTEHPLLSVSKLMKSRVTATTSDLDSDFDGKSITLGGRVAHVKRIVTKRTQQAMAQVQFEDIDGPLDLVVFPQVYERTQSVWKAGSLVYVTGPFAWRDGEPQLTVERAELFSAEARARVMAEKAPVRIEVLLGPSLTAYTPLLTVLRGLGGTHKGDTPFEVVAENGQVLSATARSEVKIEPVAYVQALTAVVGDGKVRVKQVVAV